MKENRKMKTTLIIMIALFAIGSIAHAGDLEPAAPPASTMKTLDEVEARIPIPGSATPASTFNISTSGSYYLTGDRNASGIAILVNTDNVTIDLNGYSLIGPVTGTDPGVYMNGRNNVEIHNGTVRNFGNNGIYENSVTGQNHRVINVRAISNGWTGIKLYSKNNLVKDCTVTDNTGYGIYVELGSTVSGNTCYNNGYSGIYTGVGCMISGNTSSYNGNNGIYAYPGSTVIGNTVSYNQNWGIWLKGNNLADQNTVTNNNQSGNAYGNINTSATSTYGTNHAP